MLERHNIKVDYQDSKKDDDKELEKSDVSNDVVKHRESIQLQEKRDEKGRNLLMDGESLKSGKATLESLQSTLLVRRLRWMKECRPWR